MQPTNATPSGPDGSDDTNGAELLDPEAAALVRAKEIAQRITERVRKVLGDTLPEHPDLPDPTSEAKPP
jgi:hypothetical protein